MLIEFGRKGTTFLLNMSVFGAVFFDIFLKKILIIVIDSLSILYF